MELTEQRPVQPPTVVGLLRLPTETPARRAALTAALSDFCARRELDLTQVVTSGDLQEILDYPGLYGIVLPSLTHLGAVSQLAARRQQLTAAGLQLLVVRGPGASHLVRTVTTGLDRRPRGRRRRAPVAPRAGDSEPGTARYWREPALPRGYP
ncbi:hypothetical protein OG455_27400 [Kitasatospora sp. NBC_01287]|uniref:hypothetical protein n=1 Tax=Kitasatospora sp. NBC_01287 TaxID=2903573 RepID=UPI0022541892|nr:hypothetical protein [Kitasatospora sp. NBC_01287]MCX4749186.1 hypothetical protein [Kitasatospora sp. NBC_01287]